jgi:hypothetical protein
MFHVSRHERQLIEGTLGLAAPADPSSGALVIAPDAFELEYPLREGLWDLRENLARAARVFLAPTGTR